MQQFNKDLQHNLEEFQKDNKEEDYSKKNYKNV